VGAADRLERAKKSAPLTIESIMLNHDHFIEEALELGGPSFPTVNRVRELRYYRVGMYKVRFGERSGLHLCLGLRSAGKKRNVGNLVGTVRKRTEHDTYRREHENNPEK